MSGWQTVDVHSMENGLGILISSFRRELKILKAVLRVRARLELAGQDRRTFIRLLHNPVPKEHDLCARRTFRMPRIGIVAIDRAICRLGLAAGCTINRSGVCFPIGCAWAL